MVTGPVKTIEAGGVGKIPLYLLRFDAAGNPLSPASASHLLEAARDSTDVFLFSHGWNNTFDIALARYTDFIDHYVDLRRAHRLPAPSPYRPVLVGVVWPSTSFVFPWEDGPGIAATAPDVEELQRFVTSSMDMDAASELSELVDGVEELSEAQARRAAEIVRAELIEDDDEGAASAPRVEDLLTAWAALERGSTRVPADPDDFGTVEEPGPVSTPELAGLPSGLDPRNLLRMGTVWKMKKRAGAIGTAGVGPLLTSLLDDSDARIHLTGHSFGAKVVLSAVAAQTAGQRPVRSMLLLQAAVNRWCFADDAAATGTRGGYRDVLDRVEQPVLTTRSSHDFPLTKVFQLVMRGSHVGEPQIAAIGDEERYGALGGFGPAGLGHRNIDLDVIDPTDRYDLTGHHAVVTIVGDRAIGGHGDVSNRSTAWALHCLTGA